MQESGDGKYRYLKVCVLDVGVQILSIHILEWWGWGTAIFPMSTERAQVQGKQNKAGDIGVARVRAHMKMAALHLTAFHFQISIPPRSVFLI